MGQRRRDSDVSSFFLFPSRRHASKTASETRSQNLSGCPSLTDSEVNKNVFDMVDVKDWV